MLEDYHQTGGTHTVYAVRSYQDFVGTLSLFQRVGSFGRCLCLFLFVFIFFVQIQLGALLLKKLNKFLLFFGGTS